MIQKPTSISEMSAPIEPSQWRGSGAAAISTAPPTGRKIRIVVSQADISVRSGRRR